MRPSSRAAHLLLVAATILLFLSPFALAETETETQTQTQTQTSTGIQQYLHFSMLAVPVSGAPAYPRGNGSAELQVLGSFISVHFQAEGGARAARLTLVLIANGTSNSLSNMTSSYDGEVEAEGFTSLPPGSYSVGLQVLDVSSFPAPTVVLSSSPASQTLTLVQGTQETTTTSVTTSQGSVVHEGEAEDSYIKSAIQNRQIPAVVEVGDSGSSALVTDGNFSVSVGRYQQDGYLVSIYAANVSGSRVVMVNVTSASARALLSQPVQVTLDGASLPQASALAQVLGAGTGAPARFILLSTSGALELFILIPHFSYHVIGIIPVILQAAAAFAVYVPAVLFGVAAVSVLFLTVYSRRTRVVG